MCLFDIVIFWEGFGEYLHLKCLGSNALKESQAVLRSSDSSGLTDVCDIINNDNNNNVLIIIET